MRSFIVIIITIPTLKDIQQNAPGARCSGEAPGGIGSFLDSCRVSWQVIKV